ncbi:MAG TPA: PAS domain S-box protein, partial [Coleofasciculaceae cyanobacterium]
MLLSRTNEQIQAEIENKFGFIPPFFSPAQRNPQVLENLWQQTLIAYVSNPLPLLFKEKLSAYLSRFCAVPYCMICHSCSLVPLGMKAREVLELLESPLPTDSEIDRHLRLLATKSNGFDIFLEANSPLEESLLYCCIFIAMERDRAQACRDELRRILGLENYQHLVSFIAYVKTCHVWMEAHPEVSYEMDKRVIDHLSTLLDEEPGLTNFFQNYWERVTREQQSWAEKMAAIAQRKQAEQKIREQAALLDVAKDAIFVKDLNNQIVFWNKGAQKLFGWKAEDAIGKQVSALLPRHNSRHYQDIQKTLLDQGQWQGELHEVTKDGTEAIVESRWTL